MDRSGSIITRPMWDQPTTTARRTHRSQLAVPDASAGPSTSTSAANSRSETETGDGGDFDIDIGHDDGAPSPSLERQQHTDTGTIRVTHPRRAVGIISDMAAPAAAGAPGIDLPSGAYIINDEGVGVEDSSLARDQ